MCVFVMLLLSFDHVGASGMQINVWCPSLAAIILEMLSDCLLWFSSYGPCRNMNLVYFTCCVRILFYARVFVVCVCVFVVVLGIVVVVVVHTVAVFIVVVVVLVVVSAGIVDVSAFVGSGLGSASLFFCGGVFEARWRRVQGLYWDLMQLSNGCLQI